MWTRQLGTTWDVIPVQHCFACYSTSYCQQVGGSGAPVSGRRDLHQEQQQREALHTMELQLVPLQV